MITNVIRWSVENRIMVLVMAVFLAVWGIISVQQTPVDALPDLSDVQVIIKTSYPGQAPQVVEDQVTYPLTIAMLSVPKAVTVRAYSFFGDSYVYVIFEDGTDLYWARSRVLEYLSQVSATLPADAKPTLGPDATGVGWIFEYALVDRTGQHDLAELRSLQDWFLKLELQTIPGVSEVATIGGMVRQYQVVVDPDKLRAFNIPLAKIKNAIRSGNQEAGGSVIEIGEEFAFGGLVDLENQLGVRRERGRFGVGVGVHAHDDLLAGFDRPGARSLRLHHTLFHVGILDGGDGAALIEDTIELLSGGFP